MTRSHLTGRQAAIVLALLCAVAYLNSLPNGFVWDDETLVVNNAMIRHSGYLAAAFTTDLTHNHATGIAYYRPLQTVSYMADYQLWGLNPFGYHLTNLLLHLLVVLLLWKWTETVVRAAGWRQSPARWLATAVAAVFAAHPVNTNAVAYVAGRADLLAAGAMLASLLMFAQSRRAGPERPWRGAMLYAGSVIALLAALFSRETALLMPVLVGFCCLTLFAPERNRVRHAIAAATPFAVLAGAFLLWRAAVMALHNKTLFSDITPSMLERVAIAFRALATYLGLLLWPANLQMERQLVLGGPWLHALTVLGILAAIALACALWWMRRNEPLAFFGLGWFLLCIAPLTGLVNLIANVAEHWLYLPSMGFYLAAGALLARLVRQRDFTVASRHRRLALAGCATVVCLLAARTIIRNQDWTDSITFYSATTEAAPYSLRVRNNLGRQLTLAGQFERAHAELMQAARLNPSDPRPQRNLVSLFLATGDTERALAHAQACLEIDPLERENLLCAAQAYQRAGRVEVAGRLFQRALAADPHVGSRLQFGQFLLEHDQPRAALGISREAESLDAGNADVWNLRGAALAQLGEFDAAEAALRRAARLDRHSPSPYLNLGRLGVMRGDLDAATAHFQSAARRRPDDPRAHYQLGLLRWRHNDLAGAQQHLERALSLANGSVTIREALKQVRSGRAYDAGWSSSHRSS
jgi:tetratricopeptide (TPR) repeat protein